MQPGALGSEQMAPAKKTHIIIHERRSRMWSLMRYMSSMSEVVRTFSVSVIIF